MNKTFEKELEELINKYSMENYCNIPDYEMARIITNMIINNELKNNIR